VRVAGFIQEVPERRKGLLWGFQLYHSAGILIVRVNNIGASLNFKMKTDSVIPQLYGLVWECTERTGLENLKAEFAAEVEHVGEFYPE
jgi:hypothetical protein